MYKFINILSRVGRSGALPAGLLFLFIIFYITENTILF
ncbi:Uncharacterized protein dnl_55610 [Desulfonema limicola]|uniref:Uncharacterized protein n=1 Tax=Desulfonema limicola TaxID=45656 RepID=A0A975BCX6_9BACT|nr:Uncharacterized protein dnl_55610 [Desulfonema limicola]